VPRKYILVTFNNVLIVESQVHKNLNVLCTLNVVSRIIQSVQKSKGHSECEVTKNMCNCSEVAEGINNTFLSVQLKIAV